MEVIDRASADKRYAQRIEVSKRIRWDIDGQARRPSDAACQIKSRLEHFSQVRLPRRFRRYALSASPKVTLQSICFNSLEHRRRSSVMQHVANSRKYVQLAVF